MASYKVLQDIEAEDTLIGPLTLRQCIYAAIAVLAGYISFLAVAKNATFLVLFLWPFIAFGLFFAFPWSKQQSTEVWALAKIRFYFKPRIRIWNQSGVKELVTITVPKNIKKAYSSNLSPTEVNSRLKALADTIDSRGWAVKNIDLGYFTNPSVFSPQADSDRLLDASNFPQDVPNYDAAATPDMFDVQNNPVAQNFDIMMTRSAGSHRQQIMDQMANQQPPAGPQAQGLQPAQAPIASLWHMRTISPMSHASAQGPQASVVNPALSTAPQQPTAMQSPLQSGVPSTTSTVPYDITLPAPVYTSPPSQPYAAPNPPAIDYANLRMPAAQSAASPPNTSSQTAAGAPVTAPPNPAILELANNNDLNVATIAREAQARNPDPPDEVVVSLH